MFTVRRPTIAALLVLSLAVRLVPYLLMAMGLAAAPGTSWFPWNLSPFLPVCLFGGAAYASRRLALAVPAAVYLVGDFGVWALTGRADWAFYAYQPVVYVALTLVAASGLLARRRPAPARVAGAGLAGALAFFLVTNFGVWALGGTYPLTLEGLATCYVRGLPQLGNTALSMVVFLPVLFSRLALAPAAAPRTALAPQRG